MENILQGIETIYYLTAGPILVYLAYKGLGQIKVAKENSRINSKREAFKTAAEQCTIYADKIVPLAQNFKEELKANNNSFLESFKVTFTEKGFNIKLEKEIKQDDIDQLNKSEHLTHLINSLEGYSVFYISGVAAEKVGYITTGQSFVRLVKELMPFIGPSFKEGHYKNLMLLFFMWHNRLEKEKLELKKKEIEDKLNKQGKGMDIEPIGMKNKV